MWAPRALGGKSRRPDRSEPSLQPDQAAPSALACRQGVSSRPGFCGPPAKSCSLHRLPGRIHRQCPVGLYGKFAGGRLLEGRAGGDPAWWESEKDPCSLQGLPCTHLPRGPWLERSPPTPTTHTGGPPSTAPGTGEPAGAKAQRRVPLAHSLRGLPLPAQGPALEHPSQLCPLHPTRHPPSPSIFSPSPEAPPAHSLEIWAEGRDPLCSQWKIPTPVSADPKPLRTACRPYRNAKSHESTFPTPAAPAWRAASHPLSGLGPLVPAP